MIATKAGLSRTRTSAVVDASRGALLRRLDASLRARRSTTSTCGRCTTRRQRADRGDAGRARRRGGLGKARYVGVSNFSGWRLGQAATWQRAVPGRAPIVRTRCATRCSSAASSARSSRPAGARRRAAAVLAARRRRADRQVPRRRAGRLARRRRAPATSPTRRAEVAGIVEAVATAAEGLATSPVAVALAWVRDRPGVVRRSSAPARSAS